MKELLKRFGKSCLKALIPVITTYIGMLLGSMSGDDTVMKTSATIGAVVGTSIYRG